MHDEELKVAGVTSIRTVPEGPVRAWQLVYAPDAGSDVHDPFGTLLSEQLAEHGISTVRFQFPYQETGLRRPDRSPVLEATWLGVLDACRIDGVRLIASGRSMGGRIASIVASKGALVDGLALFAYPLHPPKRPELARTVHLAEIPVPRLFCSGTRDAFGTAENSPRQQRRSLTRRCTCWRAPTTGSRCRSPVVAPATTCGMTRSPVCSPGPTSGSMPDEELLHARGRR